MAIQIKVLNSNLEADYLQLLADAPAAMFNHSLRYRKFLQQILGDAENHYLLAYKEGELVASLPLFLKQGPLGSAVNSLPFYGSNGGLLAKSSACESVVSALFAAFTDFCEEREVICSTLIESPIDPQKELYGSYSSDYLDERIGQVTKLPEQAESTIVEQRLLGIYHQKTRNMVRKGLKGGFEVGHDGSHKTLKALHTIHKENIRSIGGLAKSWSVFEAIRDVFEYGEDYRIYTASHHGKIVSALLIFYFKGIVEYFTPATLEAYRSHQPLSLLIFKAMRDAIVERGATHWNWGGTWISQDGVYQFKSRWGTTDHPYRYHIRIYRGLSYFHGKHKVDLLKGYPYFYTLPFSALEQE